MGNKRQEPHSAPVRDLSIRERRLVEASATNAVTLVEAATMAGYKGDPAKGRADRSSASRARQRPPVAAAMSEVHAASMREAVLTSANIKRRLWLLSHDAEAMGQFAPAVSAVVALHRDVERQADTHVTVQVIRIGGKDIYF